MEAMLAEQPLLVSVLLGVLAGGLIYGWLQTGKKAAAVAGLILLLLIPVAWLVASRWETDREQIESLIYEIADAVERNDHEAAVKVIGDAKTKEQARQELSNWTFHLAAVNNISSININIRIIRFIVTRMTDPHIIKVGDGDENCLTDFFRNLLGAFH